MDVPAEFVPVLLAQMAIFVALWMVLKRFWFEPALRLIAAREKRSHGAIAEAKALQGEAERLRLEHTAALDQARAEAHRDVQEMLRQAEAEQRRLIAAANEAAHQAAAEARARIAEEVAAARRGLEADAHAIAREVAKAVLGRAV
jgi:F-type H+-transporting ATPase subunit b